MTPEYGNYGIFLIMGNNVYRICFINRSTYFGLFGVFGCCDRNGPLDDRCSRNWPTNVFAVRTKLRSSWKPV